MQLELTEELRERLGETYSPGAGADLSDEFPGYGWLLARSNVEYKELAATRAAIFAIAGLLRDRPVDADLLDRARRPLVESMTKARRENAYWLKYVAEATTHPDRLSPAFPATADELLDPGATGSAGSGSFGPEKSLKVTTESGRCPGWPTKK